MNVKKVQIELTTSDVHRVLMIDLDDNAEEALAFIKDTLSGKLKTALQRH
ncbi:hypothetical protein [Desulfobacter hydrogenophilus]|nr:hypothetical protein [Desulfobacter hydrogenophilus]NDY74591.1 hypothetical protein [Desulfobacter hydrogenophilus]